MKVLIVDDNRQVLETLMDYLEVKGITCDCAWNGEAALEILKQQRFDVIVMDIMMPKMDGIAAVTALRNQLNLTTPILFLTARDALDDKTAAYQAGGDDYLIKPFVIDELILRLQALCRRGEPKDTNQLALGGLTYKSQSDQFYCHQQPLELGRIQSRILQLLLQQQPAVVSRQHLIDTVWADEEPDSDALKSHIYALRQTLKKHTDNTIPTLSTVHGKGYKLELV